jgi:PAS domain S-box-containing protein
MLGYKEDGETPLNSDDLDLIRNLLTQAALAIENAQLLDEVNQQLEEVVRLQRYSQDIIESSPAGIAVVDPSGQVVSANQAFGKLTGTQLTEVSGRSLQELLPVDSLPKPGEGLHELHIRDRDGNERYLQLTVAPLAGGETHEQRVVVVQDVTERIVMENELKEKERLASLGMLAAGVAHEVNTPITGISSYAQMLLADTSAEDPRRKILEKVEKQTFRAARIVNSLLEFARDRQREEAPVELTSQLAECLELLRERIEEKKIELEWEQPGEDILVMGNEGELQQVFSNLIVNATDAIGAEGGRLRGPTTSGCGPLSRTPGPGFHPPSWTRSSSPSTPPSWARGVPVWVSPSVSTSPAATAARSASSATPVKAAALSSSCRDTDPKRPRARDRWR